MKTTLTRLFTVMMLIMVSMTAGADVKVLYGKTGNDTFTGGKISARQEVQKDGQVAVTFTIKPDNGYTFTYTKTSLVIVSVYDPSSKSSTRADEVKVSEPLWPKGTEGTISYPNSGEYTVTVDPNLGVWVQDVTFLPSPDSGAKTVTGQSEIIRNYEGTYYIANHDNNNYNPTDRTNNYYLCPSKIYYDWNASTPNQMPFLTTNNPDPNGRPEEPIAKWKIEYKKPIDGESTDGIDYYYIKYIAPDGTEKYLVHNGIVISGKEARIRYHLQTNKDTEEDNNLFFFTQGYDKNNKLYKEFIHICPKAEAGRTNGASLNPAKNNYPDYVGHKDNNAESWKQDNTTLYCGGLIGHYDLQDKTGVWFLEDIVERPVVSLNSSGLAEINSSNEGSVKYYYTTNGTSPTTGSTEYSGPIDITNVVTIKAIAVVDGEESNEVTYTVGNGSSYLIQNQECTAYYMVPEQKESGNISINTSSVAGPKMEWYIRNAGAVNGLQYYYIVNKATSSSSSYNYLTYTESNGAKIYFASNTDKLPSGDAYKFYFRPNTDGSYSIYPKGVWDKSFHKDQENRAYPIIVISSNVTLDQAKWKFIPSSDYAYVVPTDDEGNSLSLSSESSGAAYYYVASVGTGDSYIVSNAATSTSGSNQDKSWMLMEAGTDSWQTYYYIVSAATGKYMHFLGTADDTSTLTNAVEMTDLPASPSDNYKFVLARATDANTYYIIPKTHYECFEANKFYCLSNTGSQINAELTRASKNNTNEDINAKWSFAPSSSFCLNPVFSEEEGNISISCVTIASEIHYTTDGNEPDDSSPVFTDETELSADDQYLVKAIAMQKNDPTITSEVVTLFNRPDITLVDDTYTYSGTPKEVSISKVAITITDGETSTEHGVTPSTAYAIDSYENNTNAGTATVNLVDNDDSDLIFFAYISKDFTINPATLTIEVDDDLSKGYLEDDPELTYSVTGIAGDDDEAEVLTGSLSREEGEDAGDYAINQGTLSVVDPNYTIEIDLTDKVFTINPKSVGSDTTPAQGITIDIHKNDEGTYVATVKNGEHVMTEGEDNDYTLTITPPLNTPGTKYFTMELSGSGHNYTGSFETLYALVGFGHNDDIIYSGTFVNCEYDYDFATPSGMEAYIVTDVDVVSGIVSLELVDYIPKQVPVLLLSNANTTGFFVQERDGGTDVTDEQKTSNKLQTNIADRAFGVAEIYLLYKGEFVLNAAGTLAAGKVYLPYTDPGDFHAPTRFSFIRKMSTGIDDIQISPPNPQLPSVWYTLDGRRLCGKPTKKGIYLHNGKKAVVK